MKVWAGGVLGQGAFDVERGQVAAKGHRSGPDDGIQGKAQSRFEVVEAQQGHLQDKLGAHHAVVERRVAPGEEYPLVRQVPAAHVLLHDPVAIEQVLHVLDERDYPHALREELAHPVLDGLPVQERPVFLSHDHLPIVGLYEGELLRGSREG